MKYSLKTELIHKGVSDNYINIIMDLLDGVAASPHSIRVSNSTGNCIYISGNVNGEININKHSKIEKCFLTNDDLIFRMNEKSFFLRTIKNSKIYEYEESIGEGQTIEGKLSYYNEDTYDYLMCSNWGRHVMFSTEEEKSIYENLIEEGIEPDIIVPGESSEANGPYAHSRMCRDANKQLKEFSKYPEIVDNYEKENMMKLQKRSDE